MTSNAAKQTPRLPLTETDETRQRPSSPYDEDDRQGDLELRLAASTEASTNVERDGKGPRQRSNSVTRQVEMKRDPFCVNFAHNDEQNPRTFAEGRKWSIVLVTLLLEAWANAISAMAAPAIESIAHDLQVSEASTRVVQAIYLYGFALGAVVMTPLSEDYGRRPTHIIATLLLAIFQIPCALAPNYGTLIAFRFLSGFFAATTFNAVGFISDMWEPERQSWPVNSFALAAELGAELGPILGAFILIGAGWRWIFGVAGLGTVFILVIFIFVCPETRGGVILQKRAARLRNTKADDRYFAAHEVALRERTVTKVLQESLFRPVYMLVREPIVLWFAIFDGFNYAIIYLALESILLVYAQWGFTMATQNLPFLAMLTGCIIAFGLYYFQLRLEDGAARKNNGEKPPESRLYWMIPGGVLFPISLFWFAWTSQGPPVPWVVSVLALGAFGISSHVIFISVSDYTIASYSIYSASAVGAQSLLREILSGSVTLFAKPMYKNLGYQWASTVLAFIAVVLAVVPPILYFFGPRIRAASAFALEIQQAEREAKQLAHLAKLEFEKSETNQGLDSRDVVADEA